MKLAILSQRNSWCRLAEGSLLSALVNHFFAPQWVIHGYMYTTVMEFLEEAAGGVHDVINAWGEVQLAMVILDEVLP